MMQNRYANIHEQEVPFSRSRMVGDRQHPDKMQGHWVLARAGKRVLRPGGIKLTQQMLDVLAVSPQDRVVEFAPALGVTARMVLRCRPSAYWGVEREPGAAEVLRRQLAGGSAQIVLGQVEESGLPGACASVVYGEAMLSMQGPEQKNRIFAEARRLLTAGGRYGIHELCFLPGGISDHLRREIQVAMSKEIHVGVQPLSRSEWAGLFSQNGMKVIWGNEAPMGLLEPQRVLQDEGLMGSLQIAFSMITNPMLRRRILAMQRLFRKYREHLGAISLVGRREP